MYCLATKRTGKASSPAQDYRTAARCRKGQPLRKVGGSVLQLYIVTMSYAVQSAFLEIAMLLVVRRKDDEFYGMSDFYELLMSQLYNEQSVTAKF